MNTLIAIIGLCLGGFLIGKGSKKIKSYEKYEFENRTSGGVVQHKSYEDSLKHENKRVYAKFIGTLGVFIFFGSIIFLIYM